MTRIEIGQHLVADSRVCDGRLIFKGTRIMVADAVESATRAMQDPSAGRIEALVHEIVMKRLLDGQFDESGLTLTELHRIEESLCKSVVALYHARIRYPEEGEQRVAS